MNLPTTSITERTNPWLSVSATIECITRESPGVNTYDLVIDTVDSRFHFAPGQFNMIYLPGVGEAAISISGASADGRAIAHTIREAGNVTRALARLNEGNSVGLRGPFGSAWPVDDCVGKDVILVAGGIGLAPLRPVVNDLMANRERYGDISLLVGARTAEGLLFRREESEWKKQLNVQHTLDRGTPDWSGHVGVVTALLERLPIPRPENTVLMTCGPEVMMWYTIRTAVARGLKTEFAWVSLERNMNCAIGLCGHCQLGPEFLCKDGPVFRYDRVASILKVDGL